MNVSNTAPLPHDDERSLLIRLGILLEREEEMIAARDADGISEVAEARERLAHRIAEAASLRRATGVRDPVVESDLAELYQHLRRRHELRGRLIRRHVERNARAMGVLAQAAGQASLYGADGRVALQFGAS